MHWGFPAPDRWMLDSAAEHEELSVSVVNLIVRVMHVECGGSV